MKMLIQTYRWQITFSILCISLLTSKSKKINLNHESEFSRLKWKGFCLGMYSLGVILHALKLDSWKS